MSHDSKDIRFLKSALAIAAIWSKDPSSKVGCMAVGDTPNLVAWGYNGLPPGIADTPERLADREQKYALTLHAEENALTNATFPVRSLYVTHHPCAGCALRILAARSVRRVVYRIDPQFEARWHESLSRARDLLREGGVEIVGYGVEG